jgi:hypothetical protein
VRALLCIKKSVCSGIKYMKIVISDPKLFYKKCLVLFISTVVLIPLIQYKYLIPAMLYVGGLLILHLFFFYMYLVRVPWREFSRNKSALMLRVFSVLFLIYILTILKLQGDSIKIIINLIGIFVVHVLILLFLMVIRLEFSPKQT